MEELDPTLDPVLVDEVEERAWVHSRFMGAAHP